MRSVKYSIDTSSILEGWRRHYPPDIFPGLWVRLDHLIESDELVATDEVLRELARRDDEIHTWAKQRSRMFLPIDEEIQIATAEILALFPKLVDDRPTRSGADPFVIAVAKVHNLIVVSEEQRRPNTTPERPNIPYVCDRLGIPCIRLVDLMRAERWSFHI